MSMGMMMLPPVTVSLPFKIIFFVQRGANVSGALPGEIGAPEIEQARPSLHALDHDAQSRGVALVSKTPSSDDLEGCRDQRPLG
jgi:hypothetical protein